MKKIYLLAIVMLISSCAMLTPPKFDNVEYYQFAVLNTHASWLKEECGTDAFPEILLKMKLWSRTLLTYGIHLQNNHEITQFITIIDNDIQEIITRYKEKGMSKTYCELKAEQLMIKLEITLDSIGNLN